jgi:hypothetical protein
VNCLEFRRHVGAEPFSTDPAVTGHRAGCAACARHQDELQAMDRLLGRAMRIDFQEGSDPALSPYGDRAGSDPSPRRWYAMAASLVAGVLVAATLWVSWPAPTLAAEVIDHVLHEPAAWTMDRELAPEAVAEVLDPSGARLREQAGPVTFAKRCFFDGHWVPHLVVQTDAGPVTVFLLGHRDVAAATRIDEQGFSALVLPAPHGSIAVVGRNVTGIDAIAHQIFNAVEWGA